MVTDECCIRELLYWGRGCRSGINFTKLGKGKGITAPVVKWVLSCVTWLVGGSVGPVLCFSISIKSSTCIEGGLLVFCFLDLKTIS